jgi:hypothetical protein
MKGWLGSVLHNCICHPLMPFLPRAWGDKLHDWSAQYLPSRFHEEAQDD